MAYDRLNVAATPYQDMCNRFATHTRHRDGSLLKNSQLVMKWPDFEELFTASVQAGDGLAVKVHFGLSGHELVFGFSQVYMAKTGTGTYDLSVLRTDQLYGQYLRSHPGGQHTDEANARIATGLNEAMDNLRAFPRVLREFDPSTRSKLRAALDLLVSAVKSSTSVRKAEALGASGRFEQLCATDKADR